MKLTDKIHLLKIDFEITLGPDKKLPRFVNVLIIFGNKITLVDTGVKGSEEKIVEYIRKNGRSHTDIDTIVLSHSHPDHIGSAAKIKEITGCKVLAHELEKEWIENISLQNEQRPVPGFFNLVDRPVKIDEFLVDGQSTKVDDDITIENIHSPGHSKGLINLYFKEDKILFTADSIPLKNDIPNYDNFQDLMNSLKAIWENNQYSILLTSWTLPFKNREEIEVLIEDGDNYMRKIDNLVKENYSGNETKPLEFCRKTIEKLGLSPFLANPITDRAFRSHL